MHTPNALPWLLLLAMSIIGGEAVDEQMQSYTNQLVSIIMPVYNRTALLNLALEQVEQTNYKGKMEIIVIDDSEKAIDDVILSKFPSASTLVYRHLDRRATVGEKRNMACALSKGDIIVMMDDDDIYHPNRISYQIEPIMDGIADMTVLKQDIWFQLYVDGRESRFFQANRRMARGVHYGTLAFRRDVWNPDHGIIYTDASLLDEVDFYKKVKSSPMMRVLEMPNNGMHIYVRHPKNINMGPGTDLARDPRFVASSRPAYVERNHIIKLEKIVVDMHLPNRVLQSMPKKACGACVDVGPSDRPCVTADECWDMYSNYPELVWDQCMTSISACIGCETSSEDVCEERCISANGPCMSFADCYDMYSSSPDIDCERFPSCNCNSIKVPTESPSETKCGACVDVNGPCVTADECWDMYSNSPELVWGKCMYSKSDCIGCETSSEDVCQGRCVSTGLWDCKSFADCYDMYSGDPNHDCERFPSCDCSSIDLATEVPTDSPSETMCGACVEVGPSDRPCVTADECWDMYSNSGISPWDKCMYSKSDCIGCETSSEDVCRGRCVSTGLWDCKSFADCYDMYSGDPNHDCERFPSCDCSSIDLATEVPTDSPSETKCGACVKVGPSDHPCVTADECWDMYSNSPELVWDQCMTSISACTGCETSSEDVCEERCISTGLLDCKSLTNCYDMYSSSPDIDCERFPSCDCSLPLVPGTISSTSASIATTPETITTKATSASSIATQGVDPTSKPEGGLFDPNFSPQDPESPVSTSTNITPAIITPIPTNAPSVATQTAPFKSDEISQSDITFSCGIFTTLGVGVGISLYF